MPLVCGIPRGQCCTEATRAATAAPYPATASGEDFSATSRSAQRSSSKEPWDGIAMATQRRHQAAASRAAATGWRRTETTVSRRAERMHTVYRELFYYSPDRLLLIQIRVCVCVSVCVCVCQTCAAVREEGGGGGSQSPYQCSQFQQAADQHVLRG